ncbi:MAG: HAMP domain-containing histidine kinase [Deltaproteobacteria bacterium]|jgi:two-component system sensor histidine kinase GlrK|nr:HAMP domain-containing histidine kinase [Deltaproteobacteria bacterium]
MRLSIFARLIISYLVLFIMLAGISLYFIYHLSWMNEVTRSIILNDTSVFEYSNLLTDALLSEVRNDRKYVVLKDEELYGNYVQAKDEFAKLLNEAFARAASEEMKHFFYTIDVQHENFSRLVNEERELIRGANPYPEDKFATEKKNISDNIINQLKNIRQTSENNIFSKIVNLSESGDKIKNISVIISVIALSTGLIIAFIITRSIKKPLDVMRAKTVEISKGNFRGDLDVKSPPQIAELATAINTMCHRLQEVDDIKSDFFSHMSHELRTPLTSIKEGTAMLLDGLVGETSDKQQRILRIVVQESNRMIGLVNGLLDLGKMEAGMLKYQFIPTDLATLVKESLESLAPLAESKNISIDNKIAFLQPVKIDQERILQVLSNIIGNAIKFSYDDGRIKLQAHVHVDEGFVEVQVHDTGIGIPEKDLERIFQKFQQISGPTGEKIKGTGLGLATVKQIILAHGGKVWATSRIGQGSTFYFTLPLAV